MIKNARGSMQHKDSHILVQVEETIRSFFCEQFSESPRLLKLEFLEDSIHVHGYRSLAPADAKAMAEDLFSGGILRYHETLVRDARKKLKENLQSALKDRVVDVEWFLDAVQHEFDIVITLREGDNQHVPGTNLPISNRQPALQ